MTPAVPKPAAPQLIPCSSCGTPIATLALTCPQCGAPNYWLHPGVAHFLSIKDVTGVRRPFRFVHDKVTVSGATEHKLTGMGCGLLLIMLFGTLVMCLLLTPIVGGILGVLGLLGVAKRHMRAETFRVDFSTGTWSSSNDRFWEPLRSKLFTAPTSGERIEPRL